MNNVMHLKIVGKPRKKTRARKGKFNNWYNPDAKQMAIDTGQIRMQLPEGFRAIKKGTPVEINIIAFFEPSKTEKTKKFVETIKNENVSYIKKSDIDNITKYILDLFSKIIYHDDNQVYKGCTEKYYSLDARTEIEVKW